HAMEDRGISKVLLAAEQALANAHHPSGVPPPVSGRCEVDIKAVSRPWTRSEKSQFPVPGSLFPIETRRSVPRVREPRTGSENGVLIGSYSRATGTAWPPTAMRTCSA